MRARDRSGEQKRDGTELPALRLHRVAALVAGTGLALAALLTGISVVALQRNDDRILAQRAREVAVVLAGVVPSYQTQLRAAVHAAVVPGVDRGAGFRGAIADNVGTGLLFETASLWRVTAGAPPERVTEVGPPALLPRIAPQQAADVLARATASTVMVTEAALQGSAPRVAYAAAVPGPDGNTYVAYGERPTPANRLSTRNRREAAFRDLDFALYFGTSAVGSELISASTPQVPLPGPRRSTTVPFGDRKLLIVVHPTAPLSGPLTARLPWLVAVVGIASTMGAVVLVEWLQRRRAEVTRLYAQQRTVAAALQHSLLPSDLAAPPNVDVAAHYQAGAAGVDIGGDWYDTYPLRDGRLLVVVGDVSGRGVGAATVMASLRFGIRGLAVTDSDPGVLLSHLGCLLDVKADGHFATVLCCVIDFTVGTMQLASAAHPWPLVLADGVAAPVRAPVGPPLGVSPDATYASETVGIPAAATLLAFTDGLFERRGETVLDGLERLARTVEAANASARDLDELIADVVEVQTQNGVQDDAAVLAIRWGDHARTATASLPRRLGHDESTFSPDARSARAARDFVRAHLDGVNAEVADDVLLCVSELATNAVRHARTSFTVSCDRAVRGVRIEVRDRGVADHLPIGQQVPEPSSEGGRGIAIVASIAESWGVTQYRDGTGVWFTVPTVAAPRSAEAKSA